MAISNDEEIARLKCFYEAGFNAVKTWVDSRYRVFQFCAALTVGSLTLGFGKGLLQSRGDVTPGVILCALNLFVAFVGLRTEWSNRTYNVAYFNALNEIEGMLNERADGTSLLEKGAPFTRGRQTMKASWIGKLPSVDRLHMTFYVILMVAWGLLLWKLF